MHICCMAAELGFEPRQTVPETGVLPLHNSAMLLINGRKYTKTIPFAQDFFALISEENAQDVKKRLSFSLMRDLLIGRRPG